MLSPPILKGRQKKFCFLLDYFFADDVRYDSAKPLLHLVQNAVLGGCSTREAQFLMSPRRQTCIGILRRGESKLTMSVRAFCVFNFCIFQEIFTGLWATDNWSHDLSALRDFPICGCELSWRLALASGLNYQLTLWRIDKISLLGTKLSEFVKVPWYLSTYRRSYHHQHTIFVSRSHCEVLILGAGLRFHTLPSQGDRLVAYLPVTEWTTYRCRDETDG